jgi:hypothetical protein
VKPPCRYFPDAEPVAGGLRFLMKTSVRLVVNKMINAYKAPITSKDAAEIVEYLTRTKGTK